LPAYHNCHHLDVRDRYNLCNNPDYCLYQFIGTPDEPTFCQKDEMIEDLKKERD